jgi:hypothetical protein
MYITIPNRNGSTTGQIEFLTVREHRSKQTALCVFYAPRKNRHSIEYLQKAVPATVTTLSDEKEENELQKYSFLAFLGRCFSAEERKILASKGILQTTADSQEAMPAPMAPMPPTMILRPRKLPQQSTSVTVTEKCKNNKRKAPIPRSDPQIEVLTKRMKCMEERLNQLPFQPNSVPPHSILATQKRRTTQHGLDSNFLVVPPRPRDCRDLQTQMLLMRATTERDFFAMEAAKQQGINEALREVVYAVQKQ